jgi:DNA polymerase III epsilon subunit-like protein
LIESLSVGPVREERSVMFFNMLNQSNKRSKETQVLALDCERILTEQGERLARVSIVNFYGNIVFDTLVKPCRYHCEKPNVLDYREWITGIKAKDLEHAPTFGNIEPIIKKIAKGKTIVGHSVDDDLEILDLQHDYLHLQVRDISEMPMFMLKIDKDSHSPLREDRPTEDMLQTRGDKTSPVSTKSDSGSKRNYRIQKRKLKSLSEEFLNARIQHGHHSSIIDARAALALYRLHYEDIEMKYRC